MLYFTERGQRDQSSYGDGEISLRGCMSEMMCTSMTPVCDMTRSMWVPCMAAGGGTGVGVAPLPIDAGLCASKSTSAAHRGGASPTRAISSTGGFIGWAGEL